MAEHEIPADLLHKLEDVLPTLVDARRVLTALSEWADGALIDPSTWTRVTAEPGASLGCGCPPDAHYRWCKGPTRFYTLTREDP